MPVGLPCDTADAVSRLLPPCWAAVPPGEAGRRRFARGHEVVPTGGSSGLSIGGVAWPKRSLRAFKKA